MALSREEHHDNDRTTQRPDQAPIRPSERRHRNAAPEHQPDLGEQQQPEHHLLENGDIGVSRRKGQPKRNQIPCDAERGTIVIALNVDEDHDEVHYSNVAFRGEAGELLSEALEVLVACRKALVRVRKS